MDANPLETFVPGDMSKANYEQFDLHKHVVDRITLKASDGRPMRREAMRLTSGLTADPCRMPSGITV